uniref:Uncharacterized protein n=1 Tax=Anguilla anguilla TaxID=7936 RepID=A0A0E9T5N1_ANGAN
MFTFDPLSLGVCCADLLPCMPMGYCNSALSSGGLSQACNSQVLAELLQYLGHPSIQRLSN